MAAGRPLTEQSNITTTITDSVQTPVTKTPGITTEPFQLTGEQKEKAEQIALNDTFVLNTILSAGSQDTIHIYSGSTRVPDPGSYHVANTDVGMVREVGPGLDRARWLPRTELVIGNESLGGVNLSAYVDLEEERVVYVGYTSRSGPNPGHYMYLQGEDGVTVYTDVLRGKEIGNFYMVNKLFNYTILDTGYGRKITDEDRSNILAIVENNATARTFIKNAGGRGASLNPNIWMSVEGDQVNGHYYLGIYPRVTITPIENDGIESETSLTVWIDHDRVTLVNEYLNYGRFWRQVDRH
ncbi:hypothetical protein [Methanocella sp. MCL-LM]|uniref:hypothetical protein n=1 Tax=Methanocella sp. MCL-LM TaxID=3412035 RepID=UPI003C772B74